MMSKRCRSSVPDYAQFSFLVSGHLISLVGRSLAVADWGDAFAQRPDHFISPGGRKIFDSRRKGCRFVHFRPFQTPPYRAGLVTTSEAAVATSVKGGGSCAAGKYQDEDDANDDHGVKPRVFVNAWCNRSIGN